MKHASRRQFLKTAAVGAAAALSAPFVRADGVPGVAPSDKLHVAFIGVGGKGAHNLSMISGVPGVNVVAVCDIDSRPLNAAAAKHKGARTYTDFRKLLEQKDIDAVVVTTPDHTHAIAALSAMKLGKHVYCEKPLCHDVFEIRALTETARKHKLATQMGNSGHATEYIRRQAEWVRAGLIGAVKEIHCWTDRPGKYWPQGIERPRDTPEVPKEVAWDLWLGTAPARPYHPAYHPFKWRGWWDFGTGALGDMACHIMDYPFFALGLGQPNSVECVASEGMTSETPPLWSILKYQFPAGATHPALTMFWYDGGKKPEKPAGIAKLTEQDGGTLYIGEKGALLAGNREQPVLAGADKDFRGPPPTLPRCKEEKNGHVAEWVAACKGGPPGGTNFDYSGPLSETVVLGNAAIRSGKKLEWDSRNLRITNAGCAEQFLRREYRKGW